MDFETWFLDLYLFTESTLSWQSAKKVGGVLLGCPILDDSYASWFDTFKDYKKFALYTVANGYTDMGNSVNEKIPFGYNKCMYMGSDSFLGNPQFNTMKKVYPGLNFDFTSVWKSEMPTYIDQDGNKYWYFCLSTDTNQYYWSIGGLKLEYGDSVPVGTRGGAIRYKTDGADLGWACGICALSCTPISNNFDWNTMYLSLFGAMYKYSGHYYYYGVLSPYDAFLSNQFQLGVTSVDGTKLATPLNFYLQTRDAFPDSSAFEMFIENVPGVTPPPYEPIPQPTPTPITTGAFDFHSDPVPPPSLPNISAAATGFTRLYNPSLSQLNALAQYMWTDTSFIQTVINQLKQLLDNPMDYIISLSLVPCAVPNGANISVKLLFIDTGVQMPPVTNQFVEVDCGTYDVVRNYNSALDFAPNTKVSLYLPYIGVVPLDVDEIMPTYPDESTTLGVRYVIDVFGGTCVAMVTVNGSVKYQFSGHCAISIPFNSANFSTYAGALIQAAKTVVGGAAMAAGATNAGAALLGAPVQKTSETAQASGKVDDSGNFINDPKVTMRVSSTKAQFGSLIANNISNTVSQVAASKPVIERSAGFSGNTGYLAVRRPYLLFESPRLVNPTEYGKYNGYPCMMYRSFAELSGFTQVQQIQLVGFSGTNPELDELQALLKSGVIF